MQMWEGGSDGGESGREAHARIWGSKGLIKAVAPDTHEQRRGRREEEVAESGSGRAGETKL